MARACRVLPHRSGDGPANMALDEALLDSVAADPSMAVVRTYDWTVPTLSLGYFQSIHEAEADPRWAGVPIVRRPTGGGSLWHDREVTYAVVVPGDHPAARPSRALYRTIHAAIADRIRRAGIVADRRGDPGPSPSPEIRPFLCFTDRDDDDIVSQGAKLVGSAQRRRAGAVLQHGSLLLQRSPKTPELPGLLDFLADPIDHQDWAEILAEALPEALGLEPIRATASEAEIRASEVLIESTYARPSWTARR